MAFMAVRIGAELILKVPYSEEHLDTRDSFTLAIFQRL